MTSRTKTAPGTAGRKPFATSDIVARDLNAIEKMPITKLRDLWRRRFRSNPPPVQSGDILRRLMAWKIQVEAFGDLDAQTRTRIEQLVRSSGRSGSAQIAFAATLKAGTVLVREWRGVEHRVLVLDQGFEHRDRRYRSLSEVARAIAGSHWSGPRFFGLEPKQIKSTQGDLP